ncbi:MAG TPA: outer membrane protein assembly factor BamD [Caulobacteraceae bacterium]|nr:outer membrane protein assembly factor BamD [Caulobacteraceae bacterium]
MFANVRVRPSLALVLIAAVALSGCSLLNKKKKEDTTYAEQPVEQLYTVGAGRLDDHRWSEAVTYFKEVERQHPYSEWSRRAILMEAYAHYQNNDYSSAIGDADRFIELYPGNSSAVYAYYLKAQCYFEQILDVGRDQGATQQALTAEREVARRFPHTPYAADARVKIDMINDQLAGKEMTIGRFYEQNGDMLAAVGRFKAVIDKYQTTSHTPEALERLVEAYLTLGLIEEAKENAAVLGYNYPGSYWYDHAYALMVSKGLRPAIEPKHGRRGLLHNAKSFFGPIPPADEPAPPPPAAALSAQPQPDAASTQPQSGAASPGQPPADASSSTQPQADAGTPTDDQQNPAPAKKKKKHHWYTLGL